MGAAQRHGSTQTASAHVERAEASLRYVEVLRRARHLVVLDPRIAALHLHASACALANAVRAHRGLGPMAHVSIVAIVLGGAVEGLTVDDPWAVRLVGLEGLAAHAGPFAAPSSSALASPAPTARDIDVWMTQLRSMLDVAAVEIG